MNVCGTNGIWEFTRDVTLGMKMFVMVPGGCESEMNDTEAMIDLLTGLCREHHWCIRANREETAVVTFYRPENERNKEANVQWNIKKAHQVEDSGQCALVSASSDRRLCALGTRRRGLERKGSVTHVEAAQRCCTVAPVTK